MIVEIFKFEKFKSESETMDILIWTTADPYYHIIIYQKQI